MQIGFTKCKIIYLNVKSTVNMITGIQIRAARAILNWSSEELARRVGSTRPTIHRIETTEGVPSTNAKTLLAIKEQFEAAGIEFTGTVEQNPGVSLRIR
jgi:DNA-binding transcriptional regulator YiaG